MSRPRKQTRRAVFLDQMTTVVPWDRFEQLIIPHYPVAGRGRRPYARGVGEERQRIARDLHDDVSARLLTSLHRNDVTLVRSDVRKAMSDIRSIISSLTGKKLALDKVMADLRHDTAERLEAAKIHLIWPLSDEPLSDEPPEARLIDYPIYKNLMSSHREIVSNIIRHSEASQVTVDVTTRDTELSISVEDNGKGLDASAIEDGKGNGIRNIRHRLEQINARFSVASCPQGTRIDVAIPLRLPANANVA